MCGLADMKFEIFQNLSILLLINLNRKIMLEIKVGDEVTFQRYGQSMKGTVTFIFDNSDALYVDKIHYIKRNAIIKIKHK